MALVANNDTYIVLDINETSSHYAMTIRVMITKFVARALTTVLRDSKYARSFLV